MYALRKHLLTRITAPATEPVTLAEAKLYLRVDSTTEDTLIGDLIVSARMIAENWLKRSLITQAWKLSYNDHLALEVHLPMGPVNSITSITTAEKNGDPAAIDSGLYYLNAARNAVIFDNRLFGFLIEISYATGYGDATAVPKPIKQGILAHIAAMYDSRGEDSGMELPVQSIGLYMPFREVCL